MTITLNSETREIMSGTTVAALVADLAVGTGGVAVAINGRLVTRSLWEATIIPDQADVTIIKAAYGG